MEKNKSLKFLWSISCYILLIFSLLINISQGYSQFFNEDSTSIYESPNDSSDLKSDYFNMVDSTGIYFFYGSKADSSTILTLSYDSLSKTLGGAWSNETLFLYDKDFDPTKMEDSIRVVLQDNNGHCYFQPFPGIITSPFGWRWRQYHYGVDINLKLGDTVRCAFDGVVRIAKLGWGYGNCVVVRHLNGLETLYGHMSVLKVVANQVVKAGDVLGLGGCTGKCYGTHLHFEVRYLGLAIDPNSLIDMKNFEVWKDTIYLSKKSFQYLSAYKKASTTGTTYTGTNTYYTIKSGDTLSKIAKYYGTTVKAICLLNGIKSTSILKIGRTILVK